MAKLILDIVAKNPKEQHITKEMQPSAMHEHSRKDCDRVSDWMSGEACRDKCPLLDELIAGA
jgi:hypothetical protein